MATYDVTDQTSARRVQFTGNGTAGPFAFAFQVNATSEVKVFVDTTEKTETTHYTVTLNSSTGAGTISFTTGNHPTSSQTITILGDIPLSRTSVYTSGGQFTASSLESDFDTNMFIHQQTNEEINRSLRQAEHDVISGADMTLPVKADRLGKILSFNASTGNPEVTFSVADGTTLASVSADIATLADIEDGTDATDAIQTVAGIASNVSTVASISSNVTSVASNSSNINTVAGKASLITSDFASDMALIDSTFVSKINLVTSDFVADMAVVTSDFIADLNSLATTSIIADLDLLATSDFISDLNAVEAIKANVTSVADNTSNINSAVSNATNINAVAGAITNVNNVAGSIANVNTVASNLSGVTSFAERYRVGSSDPSSDNDAGDLFFNTSDNTFKFFDGSSYQAVNVTGIGNVVEDTTPQLGGNLDGQDKNITTTGAITGATLTGTLQTASQTNITSVGTLTSFRSTGIDDNSSATAITVSEADKVLIGTTTTNWSGSSTLIVKEASGDGGISIVSASTSNNGNIGFADTEGNDFANMRGLISYLHADDAFRFMTANSERMRIDSSGNVGIGTSSPDTNLDIEGTADCTLSITAGSTSHDSKIDFVHGSTVDGGITYDHNGSFASEKMAFRAGNNGTHMTLTGAGNVGISNSAPPSLLTLGDGSSNITDYDLSASNSGQDAIFINSSDETSADGAKGNSIGFGAVDGHTNRHASICAVQTGSDRDQVGLAFHVHTSTSQSDDMIEACRINSSGNLLIGKTAESLDNNAGLSLNGGAGLIRIERNNDPSLQINRMSANGQMVQFFRGATNQVGNITGNTSSTSYNTSSDYRLKENFDYDFDATSRLKQLKPCRFNFKIDSDTTVDGFIAHEVSSIVPEAISGEKDAMTAEVLYVDGDEIPEGKKVGDVKTPSQIDPQSIDQSKLVPLLVKTIQELETRITALEGA